MGVDPGVELYSDPTTAGSNTPNTAVFLQGTDYFQSATPGGGNPYFRLSAAPEPATWLLAGGGLAAAAWRKRWRRNAKSRTTR
jgi:hypothetical protein